MPHSDHVRGYALAFGHDQFLLYTRKRMLEADGYRTDLALNLQAVLQALAEFPAYDLVVLCHSVTAQEQSSITAKVDGMPAPVPIYAMEGADSPQTFTETVARLTRKDQILG